MAPRHGHTVPRLELCGALLAVEIGEIIHDNLEVKPDVTKYNTDSKVVLGYINNDTRRFYKYVSSCIEKIRRHTKPEDWNYVSTDSNPADEATSVSPSHLQDSMWLVGPPDLQENKGFKDKEKYH